VVGGGEARDVAGVAEDLGGQDVADAEDLGERGSRRCDGVGAALAVLAQRAIDAADVGNQLSGDRLALELDGVAGSRGGEQARGVIGGEPQRSAAGAQVAQEPVQAVDRAPPFGRQLVAAIRQQPEHGDVIIRADGQKVGAVLGDGGDAAGVDAVGLAAVTGLQHAGARGQRRGHVEHGLAGGDELLGEQAPETAGAFDGPHPLRPAGRPAAQACEHRTVGADAQLAERDAAGVERDGGV
jgi:hypothetical protein